MKFLPTPLPWDCGGKSLSLPYSYLNMMNIIRKKAFALLALLAGAVAMTAQTAQRAMSLYYDRPAVEWMTEALPIGNGELGAMFFGGVLRERVQFNEKTLWTGSPKVRGAYQDFGNLTMYHKHPVEYKQYERSLDIDEAVGKVSYTTSDGVHHSREYIASHPDGVIAIRVQADKPGQVNMELTLADTRTKVQNERHIGDFGMSFSGQLETVAYNAQMRVVPRGGEVLYRGNRVVVEGANEVVIYLVAGTNYDIHSESYIRGSLGDIKARHKERLARAVAKGYEAIRAEHIADYKRLYDRVKLCLANNVQEDDIVPSFPYMTTDQMVRTNRSEVYLHELYFQFGRYLMIASSRGMDLPNNLQGIWNHSNTPPWESDIHTNINIQMNYWPAETTNLSECHLPFLKYIAVESAKPEGGMRQTAKREGLRGWSLHTQATIFSHTDWNINRPTNAWYAMHLWQHYLYTQDKEYLTKTALPAMQSACEYWFDRLVLDKQGKYIAPKEWSPEHGPWEDGIAYAQQLIAELFDAVQAASKIVKMDAKFVKELNAKAARLDRGLVIGSWGQIREWKETEDIRGNQHRHLSHLIALYPGNQISYNKDKAIADAAKVSLSSRGDVGTGWSRAWKISCWARLGDGEHAYQLLKSALNHTDHTDLSMDALDGGVYSNLFDAHPPFQIDGNFGATAGIAEMLLQSHEGFLNPLPALPRAWERGCVSGLKAVGNHEVELRWEEMNLRQMTVKSLSGQPLRIKLPASSISSIVDQSGKAVSYKAEGKDYIRLNSKAGNSYRITLK